MRGSVYVSTLLTSRVSPEMKTKYRKEPDSLHRSIMLILLADPGRSVTGKWCAPKGFSWPRKVQKNVSKHYGSINYADTLPLNGHVQYKRVHSRYMANVSNFKLWRLGSSWRCPLSARAAKN